MIYKHIEGVKVTAQFTKDRCYRYRLEITLQSKPRDGKTACVVMQNPSYAGEDVADKSVQFMEKVVFQQSRPEFRDVRRLIVVNQFARIQTKKFQGYTHEIGVKNNSAIKTALQESDIIILGWGSANRFRDRQAFVFKLIKQMSGKQLFKTRTHPSRGRYNGFIKPFNIEDLPDNKEEFPPCRT